MAGLVPVAEAVVELVLGVGVLVCAEPGWLVLLGGAWVVWPLPVGADDPWLGTDAGAGWVALPDDVEPAVCWVPVWEGWTVGVLDGAVPLGAVLLGAVLLGAIAPAVAVPPGGTQDCEGAEAGDWPGWLPAVAPG